MSYINVYELFPTNVVRTNCKDLITDLDHLEMIKSIDLLIKNKIYNQHEIAPKYQTYSILFQENSPPVWQKLKKSFYKSCENYLTTVKKFCPNQDTLEFTHSLAWAYKWYESLNKSRENPWHNHNPSFLSGVYYIKIPKDCHNNSGGTEFHDPRVAPADPMQNQCIEAIEHSWIIFPGWFSHKSNLVETQEPRYVVSANMYVKVR
jgi:hypothetical protein